MALSCTRWSNTTLGEWASGVTLGKRTIFMSLSNKVCSSPASCCGSEPWMVGLSCYENTTTKDKMKSECQASYSCSNTATTLSTATTTTTTTTTNNNNNNNNNVTLSVHMQLNNLFLSHTKFLTCSVYQSTASPVWFGIFSREPRCDWSELVSGYSECWMDLC